jgi:hypothetical protein
MKRNLNVVPAHAGRIPARHPEEPRACAASRRMRPLAFVAHPSRLAVKNGEHLRMTAECRVRAAVHQH